MSCRRVVVASVAVVALAAAACDEGRPRVRELPEETSGPYVVVAVDNHFHDIHAEDDITIAAERGFVVRNEGSNLHNFTVVGTDVSEDVASGEELRWPEVGEAFGPGTHHVICRYHDAQGMVGEFTVAEAPAS